MFICASEASMMTWEARHITNFGIFCKNINNEIELAAKRGCSEVTICSRLIWDLSADEKGLIKNALQLAGYKAKWKKLNEDDQNLHIMWEVNDT